MHNPSNPSVAAALDIQTLTAVRREVKLRADDWRAAWNLYPSNAGTLDPRLARAAALDTLATWLDEQITIADAAMSFDLDDRISLTPAGSAALVAAKQLATIIRFPTVRDGGAA